MSDRRTFAEIWALLDGVEGWLSEGQARMLHEAAFEVEPPGLIVEIGSFRGRSAIVLGASVTDGVRVVAIDPHAGTDRGPREIVTTAAHGDDDHSVFNRNLQQAGVADRVEHVRAFSDRAHGEVDGEIDVLFIDGAHRYAPARTDIAEWGARVRPGGVMLIHDSFNSVGVTLAQFRELVPSDEWRYDGRSRSLARYRKVPLGGTDRVRNAGRQLAELGYFARSVAIKTALAADQPGLARRLGHEGDAPWPY